MALLDIRPDFRVEERGLVAVVALAVVLDSEEVPAHAPRVFEAARRKSAESHFATVEHAQEVGDLHVAGLGQLAGRELPVGLARVSADEGQFAIRRPFRVPLQEILGLRRLAILVGAEDADIEIEARILEVVRIAAVKGDLLLGREDEPDIVVTFVAIQIVDAALVERDHVGAKTSLVFALLLDLGDDVCLRLAGLVAGQAGRHARVHALGDVFDRHQDVQFEVGRLCLLRAGLRVEAVAHVVVLLAADLLQGVEADVMIGNHESIRGDKRTAAAGVEAHARFLQMFEPLRSRLELILLLELLERRIVEEPHALVGEGGRGCEEEERDDLETAKREAHRRRL